MEITTARRLRVPPPAPSPVFTPQFRAWFRDSKIVHEDGMPRVVYHGSFNMDGFVDGRFSYDYKGISDYGDAEIGFFFSGAAVASAFAGSTPGYGEALGVIPVYLCLQRPRTISSQLFASLLDAYSGDDWIRYKAGLLADGCDGIIVTADPVVAQGHYGVQFTEDNYIAFRPEQIKSAIGNSGQFDPLNSDIAA